MLGHTKLLLCNYCGQSQDLVGARGLMNLRPPAPKADEGGEANCLYLVDYCISLDFGYINNILNITNIVNKNNKWTKGLGLSWPFSF